jgi:hypothetical protein
LPLRWAAAKEKEKEITPSDLLMHMEVKSLLEKLDERLRSRSPEVSLEGRAGRHDVLACTPNITPPSARSLWRWSVFK